MLVSYAQKNSRQREKLLETQSCPKSNEVLRQNGDQEFIGDQWCPMHISPDGFF